MPIQNSSSKNPMLSTSMYNIYMECKTTIILLLLLSIPLHVSQSAICSSSVSELNAINIQIHQFSVSNSNCNSEIKGSAQGPISNSLYFLYGYTSPIYSAIRRVDAYDSLVWMKTVSEYSPYINSLVVDSAEQYVYCTLYTPRKFVVRFSASNGDVIDAKKFYLSYFSDTKVSLLSDNSGYYIIFKDSQSCICI